MAADLGSDLGVRDQGAVLRSLLDAPPLPDGRFSRAVLRLLRPAENQVLDELFDDGGELLGVLLARIPRGHALRGELDDLIARRFRGGGPALAAGRVEPHGQPRWAFSPWLLDDRLFPAEPTGALGGEWVRRAIDVMAQADPARMIGQLRPLPLVQRARAGRWLASARAGIHAWAAQADAGDVRNALRAVAEVLGWVYRDAAAAAQVPGTRAASAWPVPVVTQSGYCLPGEMAGDARAADEVAAAWFPPVIGAVVWHLHLDRPTGDVLAGDRSLTPEQFYGEVMGARQWPGTVLVIVGCWAAAVAPGAGASAARVLARLGGPVLAADTVAWTTAAGRVLAAPPGLDAEGRPVLDGPGNWVLVAHRRAGAGGGGPGPAGHPWA